MEPIVSFGYWLRRQRKALDLTQQALAERVGCSLAAIKKIEQDERRPSRQIAGLLAGVLGVPAGERELFLEVARGTRPVDQLPLAHRPVGAALPTGIVTFLFTDIENSTGLAQEHPEEWERLRARHQVILSEAIEAHNGYIFQVVGDAFCAAFHTPNQGLRAAIEAQRKLQMEDWGGVSLKVRMGLHTDEAQAHGSEYRAYLTLSLVQRLMSAGHGGQILLSQSTENLLPGHLPEDISLLDLGEHKFKGIFRPLRVFQLSAPDLRREFPALRAQDISSNNIPVQLTSFIGREKEIAEVLHLLDKARLVTLTGPGGAGKSRLSIQIAHALSGQYPDGVWVVELAPIMDARLVPRATAIAMGLREEPHRPVIDMLVDYLREKQLLLLLDNCEHLIEACAQMADALLHACPQIRILATSREAFGMAGETLYLVPSLTRPDIRNLPALEALRGYEAIRLFVERAASVLPTFTLTNTNASSIVEICQRLDGIPLAIELAASKMRALSPRQIAQRLEDRFHILSAGNRTALPRHQTLQAAIQWSYNLLSPAEQAVFRRAAVFVNGWTLEAAEAVCPDRDAAWDGVKAEDVLELLTQLINKSLLLAEEQDGQVRYHMLETIRQFAGDKLQEATESKALHERHLEYFLDLAEAAAPFLLGIEQLQWLERLGADYENLRSALTYAWDQDLPNQLLRLCAALGQFWHVRGYWQEGSSWLKKVLSREFKAQREPENIVRIQALYRDAHLAENLDDLERLKTSAESCFALAQEAQDLKGVAIARIFIAISLSQHSPESNESAAALIEKSISELRALGEPYWELYACNFRNLFRLLQGDLQISEESDFTQAVDLARRAGERSNLSSALHNHARWLYVWNRIDEAQKQAEEAALLLHEIGSDSSRITYFFGQIAFIKGDYEKSKSLFMEIQQRLDLLGEKRWKAGATEFLATMAIEQNDLDQAQTYYEQFLNAVRELDDERGIAHGLTGLGITDLYKGNIARCKPYFRDSISILKGFGWNVKIGELTYIIHYMFRDHSERCVAILGAIEKANQANQRMFPALPPSQKSRYDAAVTHARETLGEAAFELEFARGKNMTLDEALDGILRLIEEL